jgi:(p)ppGpp synthase/HD superfamily hydrolase
MELDTVINLLYTTVLAGQYHGQQQRRGGELYIFHPYRVARRLLDLGVRHPPIIKAALLHDTLEDTEATFSSIEREAGITTALLVQELTNKPGLKGQAKTDYMVEKMHRLGMDALLIKLSDRLDNITDLKPADERDEWSLYYADQSIRMLRTVKEKILESGPVPHCALFAQLSERLRDLGYGEI